MLKIATIPVISRMISKIDLAPIIERVKTVDIFDDTVQEEGAEKGAKKALSPEKVGVLGAEVIAELMPQLDKIGADIPEFVALYKGVSLKEANELDFAEVLNELVYDEGIRSFFTVALRKKVEQER